MDVVRQLSAVAPNGLITPEIARSIGLDAFGLARLERSGGLQRVRRGVYVDPAAWPVDRTAQHVLHTRATLLAYGDGVAASHHSASLLFGQPVYGVDLGRVRLVRTGMGRRTGHGERSGRPGLVIADAVPRAAITRTDGYSICNPALAAFQISCLDGVEAGVVTLDAQLRAGLCTSQEFLATVGERGSRRGSKSARRVSELADGRSESVGESRLRVRLCGLGYLVEPQVNISANGAFVARVDLYIRQSRVVIEFDGAVKYRTDAQNDGRFELRKEKQREDRLRDLGCQVVRFGWADLDDTALLRNRVERAIARSRRAA